VRDHLFWNGRAPTQDDRIELGRLFDRTLTHEREVQAEKVLGILRGHCVELKENKPRNERDVLNLACLIRRETQKDFEQGVFEAAKQFDNHYAFDFNGPWPAQNFVEVELQT
jgi:gas vesicle protein GvpL/GvpF